tara:strand:- start:760 stop:1497 length:738 start_codon:yes stop_codon:yes gene_type:complete
MKKIVIIGATSAMAEAVARLYATRGDELYLLARNEERLLTMAADLNIRGAHDVHTQLLDVNELDAHQSAMATVFKVLGKVDVMLMAHGTLPDQKACENDMNLMLHELNTNAISTVSLLSVAANQFEAQKSGTLAVISSVAGERGRQSNYVYGAAKGMVSTFLQGLRNRLHASSVNVLDIKPGFVDTPMTAHLPKGFLWAQPDEVAKSIIKGIDKKKNIIYTPSFWRLIMLIVTKIPEPIFKKLML